MRARMDFDLEEMLELRRSGWSFVALAKKYRKDRTTLMYHCKKHGVVAQAKLTVEMDGSVTEELPEPDAVPMVHKVSKYQDLLDEESDIRPSKSYAELLKQAVKRKDSDRRHYKRFIKYGYPNLAADRSSARVGRLGSDRYES